MTDGRPAGRTETDGQIDEQSGDYMLSLKSLSLGKNRKGNYCIITCERVLVLHNALLFIALSQYFQIYDSGKLIFAKKEESK